MSRKSALVVEFDPSEHALLLAEATRRGIHPEALAREYVLAGVGLLPPDLEDRPQQAFDALARLATLRTKVRQAGYPSVDGAELARRVRDELNQRSRT
jgi:hypothetical protein